MKVGIVQHSFSEDVDANRTRNLNAIESLASEGADLVVLSELHDSLYFCQTENVDNFLYAESIPGDFTTIYSEAARDNHVVLVTSMFERRAPGLYHNTAIVFDSDGSICGKYRKMHIPDDPGFYEKFYFTPGDLGFYPIETSIGKLGVLVCWDQWYPEAARIMAMRGASMLIYPTAIGWNPDDTDDEKRRQLDAWTTIQRSHAVANGIPVVSVNRCGFEEDPSGQTSGIDFWGSSFVVGPQGEFLFRATDNAPCEEVVTLDMKRSENVRQWWPFFRDRRIDYYDSITRRFLDDEK
ncbi:MAG: carbon-nitrogen hydrolase [Muribaculaceae bacterium]|nr:carbon-nitrogen hydrolase [Bacteroidales bacterium]MDY2733027.1 carbon-nitrogen hydrolase [Muribaculaceae bacterium]MDD6702576.1 carbon-nitrogen hydrolase [Bacteroidales bacterium]MDD6943869.1 carbon-nitrogen hydrolase [Bacteroidales bacterium]MDY4649645.1 carbon-nitrogen hydrolase [Muribaculaceae bacterium]